MLLADESVNKNLINVLRRQNYEVFSVTEQMPSAKDKEIAIFSLTTPKIIVTEDKDFGEIVYYRNVIVTGVILLRYLPADYILIEQNLLYYLAAHLNESVGNLL